MIVILILLLAVFQVTMIDYLTNNPNYYQLDAYTWETEEFRSMKLGELITSEQELNYQMIAALMIEEEYDLTKLTATDYQKDPLMAKKPVEFQKLVNAYRTLIGDLRYFPIPLSKDSSVPPVAYEDGWQDKRSYGGERLHEGCDIMGTQKERGFYPVVSMSDGVIEKVGWLEQGGWRLGVRTPGGVYLYYAHLYQYAREWKEGDPVKAGELLGFMGDSGYSAVEGTVGNFDVHLHVGIYLKTDHYEELSVNPYWILRYLEKYRLKYWY